MPIFLLLLGLLLIIVNIKATFKDEKSFKSMLQYNKEDMSEATIAIGQIRKDIAESLTELQQDILDIKKRLSMIEEGKGYIDNSTKEELLNLEDKVNEEESVINEIDSKSKAARIMELIKEGYSDDEICNKLSVGKGEILLVKGLFKD